MSLRGAVLAVLLFTFATPALAEVSDKIPSVGAMWGWAIGLIALALLLGWKRPAMGLLVVPIAAINAWGGYEMVTGDFIGRAILREQGHSYVDTVYLTGAIGVIGPLLAVLALAFGKARSER